MTWLWSLICEQHIKNFCLLLWNREQYLKCPTESDLEDPSSPPQPTLFSHYSASVHTSAFHPIRSLYSLCLTHHLFHAPLSLANDAWRCNVANLTALPVLKSYSPLIKAAVHPFMAFSLSANRSGSATALLRIINGNKPSETGKKVRGEEEEEEEEFCS